MAIHVSRVDIGLIPIFKTPAWEIARLPAELADQVIALHVEAVQPDAEDDRVLEDEWRAFAPTMLAFLTQPAEAGIVWAEGPMEWDGLPRVFPYIVRGDTKDSFFHVERMTNFRTGGYITGWLAFEFSRDDFARMMQDRLIDLSTIHFAAAIMPERLANKFFMRPLISLGWSTLLEASSLIVLFNKHFTGCNLVGTKDRVEKALAHAPW